MANVYRVNKAKTLQYMKNVGKSFGYAFTSTLAEANPTVVAMFNQTKEQTSNLYHGITDIKTKFADFNNSTIGKDIKDTFQYGFNNLIADLKSGNWYNNERSEKAAMDMMSMDLDFDDFGDFDFDFDENTDAEISANSTIQEKSTKAEINAMDAVGQRSSAAVGAATIHSADYIVKSNRANTSALFKLNSEGFSTVATGIAAVNSNIGILVEMSKPLTEHMQNSSLFYAKTTEYQEKSLKLLEQIAANTAPKSSVNSNYRRSKKTTLMDLINNDGTINIESIKKMGKDVVSNSSLGLALSMMSGFGNPKDLAKTFLASPLQFPLEWMMGGLLNRKGTKNNKRSAADAMSSFNDVLAGFFPGMIGKLKSTDLSKTNLPPWIQDILIGVKHALPGSGLKKKMDTSNYEKGKVDWDGIGRQALTEVIPTQLGKILSALTGEEEQRYDYRTGRWVKVSNIRKMYKDQINSAANRAGGALFYDLRRSVKNSSMSKKDKRDYDLQIQEFLNAMFLNDNEDFMKFIGNGDFDYKKYKGQISEETLKDLRKRARTLTQRDPKYLKSYARDMYSSRARYGADLDNTNDITQSLHNRSLKFGKSSAGNSILNTTDEFGNSVFYYLQGIWQSTGYIVDNFTHLIPGSTPNEMTSSNSNNGMVSLKPLRRLSKTDSSQQNQNIPTNYIRNISIHSDDVNVNGSYDREKYEGYSVELIKYEQRRDKGGPVIPEMEEKIAQIKNARARKDKANSIANKFIGKFKDNKFVQGFADISGVSTDAIIDILDASSQKLNDFIYGNGSNNEKSFSSIVSESVGGVFKTFTTTISNLIPGFLKDWGKSIANALGLKEKWNNFKQGTGRALRNFFFGNKDQENNTTEPHIFSPEDEGFYDDIDYQDMMSGTDFDYDDYAGTGSGLRTFYRKATNAVYNAKARNIRGWRNNSYNYGNNIISYNPGFSAGASRNIRDRRKQARKNKKMNRNSSDDAAAAPSVDERIVENITEAYEEKLGLNQQDDKKSIVDTIKNIIKEMGGDTKYAMGAGAAIGGGLSLLTGVGLGPIAAAAVGAGVGFVSKSERAQKFLFGEFEDEVDENGNKTGNKTRKGSIIPKKLANFLERNAPEMVKTTTVGAGIGLVTGSPVLGAILGSAVGFVKSSDNAKKWLFGGNNKDGEFEEGLIKKSTQDMIKKKVPSLSLGAIGGLMVGPFPSPIANMILGSAVGMVADSEKFKNWMFGEADKNGNRSKFGSGGFSEMLKTTLFNPIVDLFKNLTSSITSIVKNTFQSMGKGIRRFILKQMGRIFKLPGINKIAKGVKKVGKALYQGVTAPVRMASNAARKFNIRHGFTAYQDGEIMDVNARNQYRDENMRFQGNRVMDLFDNDILGKMVNVDESEYMDTDSKGNSVINQQKLYNAKQSRADQLAKMQEYLGYLQDPTKAYDNEIIKERQNAKSLIKDIAKGRSEKEAEQIKNMYNKYLRKGYLSKDDYQELVDFTGEGKGHGRIGMAFLDPDDEAIKRIRDEATKLRKISEKRDEAESSTESGKRAILEQMNPDDDFKEYMNPLMDHDLKDSEIQKMKDYIEIEQQKLAKEMEQAKKDFNINENISDNTSKLLDTANKNSETFEKMLDKLEKMTKSLDKLAGKADQNSSKSNNESNDNRESFDNLFSNNDTDPADNSDYFDELQDFMAGGGSRKHHCKKGAGKSGIRKFYRLLGLGAGGDDDILSMDSGDGNPDVDSAGEDDTVRDQYGNEVDNAGSTKAKEKKKAKAGIVAGLMSLTAAGASISRIEASLNNLSTKLVGSIGGGKGGEGGSGILDTIGNLLTGGKLGDIKQFIGKPFSALAKFALPAAGTALIGAIATGKLDSTWSKSGLAGRSNEEKAVGTNASYTGMSALDSSGKSKAIAMDEKGKPVRDEAGNYIATDGSVLDPNTVQYEQSAATDSLSTRWNKSLARGAVLSVAKKITGNKLISTGAASRTIKSNIKSWSKAATKAGEKSPLIKTVIEKVKSLLTKLFNTIKNSKIGTKFSKAIDTFKDDLITLIMEKTGAASKEVVEEAAKSLAKIAGIVIAAATILWDFEEGYNNASATWKVAEPSIGQKIGSGIIHAIMNFIPFIGILVPESAIIDLYANAILPLIDKDAAEKLQDDRKAAELELADYNTREGTNLTWEEYTKKVKQNYTWGEKASNAVKTGAARYVQGVKNIGEEVVFQANNIKEGAKKVVSNVAEGAKKAGNAVKEGASNIWNGITGLFNGGSGSGLYGYGAGVSGLVGKIGAKTEALQDVRTAMQNGPTGMLAGIMSILNSIKNSLSNTEAATAAQAAVSGAVDVLDSSAFIGKANPTANTFLSKIKNFGSKALNMLNSDVSSSGGEPKTLFGKLATGVKGWLTHDESSGAGASGMVSQRDPKYAGMKMGGRSVGDMGCGPASAVNALNALGKSSSMSSAVNLASKYQTTGGTDLSYFADEFSRNGVGSSYVSGRSMIDAVASGTPTVLMGRDPSNTSKSRSPFGPNSHYVVANGIDRNGNINISDPELNRTRKYSPSILRSVRAGVAATGTGLIRRFNRRNRRFGFGAGDSGENKQAIWRYLTSNGFNDYAAAGLMGCWECESGNNPRRIEADYIKKFPGYDKVMASNESLDDYTVNILFPAYTKISINKSAYIASDGHYYPGIGLAQWTGPRGYNVIQYTKEKGKGWDDLQTQLEFAIFGPGEFKSRAGGTLIDLMNQAGSIEKTTELAFTKYEGCRMSNIKGYNKRLDAAKAIYNTYSGKTYTGGIFDGITSSTGSFTTTSKGTATDSPISISSIGDVISNITGAFTTALGNIFSGNKDTTNTTSSYNTSGSYTPTTVSSEAAQGDRVNGFPYFNQREDPWAKINYSSKGDNSQTIKSSGCGPTSMAMILKSFGQNATPQSVARYSVEHGHRTADQGTSWSLFNDIANKAQLNSVQFSSTEDAKNYLRKGYPVIASMGPGDFTKGGHYVVLSGIQGNNFMVNDPASRTRSNTLYDTSKLSQSKQFWAFSKDDKGTLTAGEAANVDHYAGKGSGLFYNASGAGNRILLDNSGRFSAGDSGVATTSSNTIKGRLLTGNTSNQYTRNISTNNNSGVSQETKIMLKAIIQLVTTLVENTSKIGDIFNVVKDICEKSGNSELKEIAGKIGGYHPRTESNQKTLESLNDLRDMVDSIVI